MSNLPYPIPSWDYFQQRENADTIANNIMSYVKYCIFF